MYIGGTVRIMTSYLLSMLFFYPEIKALQHGWKKGLDRMGDYVEK